jgi:hypothetical protein
MLKARQNASISEAFRAQAHQDNGIVLCGFERHNALSSRCKNFKLEDN